MGESARKTVDQTRVSETLCINNLRKHTYMLVLSLGDDLGTYPPTTGENEFGRPLAFEQYHPLAFVRASCTVGQWDALYQ